jgi:hypothetical protein
VVYLERLYLFFSDRLVLSSIAIGHQQRIFQLLEEATTAASGGAVEDRLSAAFCWVYRAIEWSHPSELDAYRRYLELLQALVSTGSSLESTHYRITSTARLKHHGHMVADAAACAIREGRTELALEFLEQGRSLLLTQAGRYRTPVDELEGPLADEFRTISSKMEASAMTSRLQDVDRSSHPPTQDRVAVYVHRL